MSPPAAKNVADDAELVGQACAGDMMAFGRLVSKYQDRLVNTCWRICGNLDDAEDLAQEALIKAMGAIGSFEQRSRFYTWLFRIAVNVSISYRRKRGRTPVLLLHQQDGDWSQEVESGQPAGRSGQGMDDPSARLVRDEAEKRLAAALDQLDDDHRVAVILRDIEGLDYHQIAEIIEVPAGTVKSRIHRGRMELRERLRPFME